MIDMDRIAEAIRTAYLEHTELPRPPWDEMPETRKEKWRKMANAAVDAFIEETG